MASISKWSDAKLDKELAFAERAVSPGDSLSRQWLEDLRHEAKRRSERTALLAGNDRPWLETADFA